VVSPPFVPSTSRADQFTTLSANKTHLVNTITNKPVFITGDQAYELVVTTVAKSIPTPSECWAGTAI
jgi:hypothetical protein